MGPEALLSFAFRSARYYARSTLGSTLVIAICFMSLASFRLYILDASDYMALVWRSRLMYGDFVLEKDGSPGGRLTLSDQRIVEDLLRGVDATIYARFLAGQGLLVGQDGVQTPFAGKGYDAIGGEALRGPLWRWDAVAGKPLSDDGDDQAMLGTRLAAIAGCRVPPTTDLLGGLGYPARERPYECPSNTIELLVTDAAGRINRRPLRVTGIFDALFRELDVFAIALPLTAMQTLLGTDEVSYFAVATSGEYDVHELVKELHAKALARGLALRATPWQQHPDADLYRRTISVLDTYSSYIASIMLALAALIVFGTAAKVAEDRRQEIGVLRALGFVPRDTIAAFAIEAAIVAIHGVALGVFLTLTLTAVLRALNIEYFVGGMNQPAFFNLGVDWRVYALTGLGLVATSIGATVVTVYRRVAAPLTLLLASK